jgi:hypothetical protein
MELEFSTSMTFGADPPGVGNKAIRDSSRWCETHRAWLLFHGTLPVELSTP